MSAALLFGAGTPLAKWLMAEVSPWMMAALLYLGSGLGLLLYRTVRRIPRATLKAAEWPWFLGAVSAGGVLAPVLLTLFHLSSHRQTTRVAAAARFKTGR